MAFERRIQTQVAINRDETALFDRLHFHKDPEDEHQARVLALLDEAILLAKPKYAQVLATIDEKNDWAIRIDNYWIESPLVRQNLADSQQIVVYLATCGQELEAWSDTFDDYIDRYWADEIKQHFLAQCLLALRTDTGDRYFKQGGFSQMNPGSLAQWPVTGQQSLFALLGPASEAIGVTLTDSCLMLPSKSVSGFYFSSTTAFENCRLCPRARCPSRRVAFEAETH